jgi:hypothetical protein
VPGITKERPTMVAMIATIVRGCIFAAIAATALDGAMTTFRMAILILPHGKRQLYSLVTPPHHG